MVLYILSPALVALGMIEEYESVQWIRRFYEPGDFEIDMPYNANAAALLKKENIVVKGEEAGVIESVRLSDDGADRIECRGYSLAGYAKRRILWNKQTITDTPENVMRKLAEYNIGPSAGTDRAIANLAVAPEQASVMDAINYQSERENLCDELQTIGEQYELGWDITLSDGVLSFVVLNGLDRSLSQQEHPRAIFSRSYENISSPEYEEDARDMKNVVLVTATLNDAEITETVGTETGYLRRETTLAASGVDKDENGYELDESESRALMRTKGAEAAVALAQSFSGDAAPVGNLTYCVNYNLGDVVTCLDDRWGVTADMRITEVKEIYEKNGLTLSLTFGKGVNFRRWS